MTEEKKKQLFPIFAFLYSKEINPEKYGNVQSMEEWADLIQTSPEDMETISQAATNLSDEEWTNIENQFQEQEQEQESPAYMKNGAKLNTLKKLKSMKNKKTPTKCACGCDMIDKKEAGGKIVSSCSCGCKTKKKEEGGNLPVSRIKSPQEKLEVVKNAPSKVRNIYEKMKVLKIK